MRTAQLAMVLNVVMVGVSLGAAPAAHVERMGEGPVDIVLIPGLGCDWTVWRTFMERHADDYTMCAVTLPGMAGTNPPPAPEEGAGPTPWLDNAVQSIVQVIDEEDLNAPIVIGHSLGGFLAFRLAHEHPGLMSGVVTVDGLPAIPLGPPGMSIDQRRVMVNNVIASQLNAATDEEWEAQTRSNMRATSNDPERTEEIVDMAMSSGRDVITRYLLEYYASDATTFMGEIKSPALAIAAINDAFVSLGMDRDGLRALWTRQMSAAPLGDIVFVEDSLHSIMDDDPEALDAAISAFVDRVDSKD